MNKLTTFINNNYIFFVCIVILGMLFFLTSSTFPYFADDIYFMGNDKLFGWSFYIGNPRFGQQIISNIITFKVFSNFIMTLTVLLNCYLIFLYSFSRNIFNSTTQIKDSIYYILIFLLFLVIGEYNSNLWLAGFYNHTFSVLIILACFMPFYYLLQGKDVLLKKYWLILLIVLSVYPLGFSSYTSVPLWLIASGCSVLFYIYRYKKIPFIHIAYIILTFISYYLMMFVFKLNQLGHHPLMLSKINTVYKLIVSMVGTPLFYVYIVFIVCIFICAIYLIIKNKNIKYIVLNNNLILLKSFLLFLLLLFGCVMFIKADYFGSRHFIGVVALFIISLMIIINFIDISLSNKYKKIFLYPAFLGNYILD